MAARHGRKAWKPLGDDEDLAIASSTRGFTPPRAAAPVVINPLNGSDGLLSLALAPRLVCCRLALGGVVPGLRLACGRARRSLAERGRSGGRQYAYLPHAGGAVRGRRCRLV